MFTGLENLQRVAPASRRPHWRPAGASLAVALPEKFPQDPSDRLIAATAMVEGMSLVTADLRIRQSKVVETIW
jgi:PIN domain nuclease of toxin-antitoxin system